jgi:hypothetical protein
VLEVREFVHAEIRDDVPKTVDPEDPAVPRALAAPRRLLESRSQVIRNGLPDAKMSRP